MVHRDPADFIFKFGNNQAHNYFFLWISDDKGNDFYVIAGINEQQESRLSIYPNPATDKITIETSAIPTKSQLSIMNLSSQEILTRQITEPKTQIDISNLPSGVYFVRLTNDKSVEVGKFIKY